MQTGDGITNGQRVWLFDLFVRSIVRYVTTLSGLRIDKCAIMVNHIDRVNTDDRKFVGEEGEMRKVCSNSAGRREIPAVMLTVLQSIDGYWLAD